MVAWNVEEKMRSNREKLYHRGEQSAVITFISSGLLLERWGKTSAELSVFAMDCEQPTALFYS